MKKTLRPSGGHILDIDAMEVADNFLSLARNINTRKGFPSRINGRRVAYDSTNGNALHLLNLSLNTFNWWMLFGATTIRAAEGTNVFDISPVGLNATADPREWTSALLNGIPVATNGKNLPLWWNGNGATPMATLPGWPAATTCGAIATFKFHIFAMNIDGPAGTFNNLVMWSDSADPGALPTSWTPGAGNEAGSAILADTEGRCIMGRALNTQFLIYKPTSFHAFEYVGQQPDNIFTQRAVSRVVGVVGPNALAEINLRGPKHILLTQDDVVLNDGLNPISVADSRVKRYIINSIDETNSPNSFVVVDKNNKEVWVCIPESGNQFATTAHVWDYARDEWTLRDLNQVRHATLGYVLDTIPSNIWDNVLTTWDTTIKVWNAPSDGAIQRVLSSEATELYLEDTSTLTSVTGTIQKLDLTCDDESLDKLTTRVWIEGSGTLTNVQFRLGSRNDSNAAIAWGALVPRSVDGAPYEVHGKFISIEITCTTTDVWTINRITIEYVPNGTN